MHSFAHMADCHLGFQRSPRLQRIEQEAFEGALDTCIGRGVDFVLISGDLFHNNLPDMRVARFAFKKFREVYERGIPVYAVYGSHDYSPVSNSVIDLLADTGYIRKATVPRESTGGIRLEPIRDKTTGARITGLPGRTAGLEKRYYDELDRAALESEDGFKIFMFHCGIDELRHAAAESDSMPLSMLPKNFDYYAGGHVHASIVDGTYDGYGTIAYPGTLFAGHHSDMEASARETRRGFIIAHFGERLDRTEFVDLDGAEYELVDFDADAMSPSDARSGLDERLKGIDPKDKIVFLKVRGELSEGRTSDVGLGRLGERLQDLGAIDVKISQGRLSSREYNITPARGENRDEIIQNILGENIGQIKTAQDRLAGPRGVELARHLLEALRQQKHPGETAESYRNRMTREAFRMLGVDAD